MSKKDTPEPANPLLRLLGAELTEADLAELDAEIEATQARLAGLIRLQSVARAMLGKEPVRGGLRVPRKQREAREAAYPPLPPSQAYKTKPAEFDLDGTRKRVGAFLVRYGSKTGHEVITECKVGPTKIAEVMAHEWFHKDGNLYRVTPAGRAALAE